jgi:hypothetical protein
LGYANNGEKKNGKIKATLFASSQKPGK